MRHPQARVDPPRSEFASQERQDRLADGTCRVPAWDRERLIDQFQRIDGSTRVEAEQEIVAFEQSFRSELADPFRGSPKFP